MYDVRHNGSSSEISPFRPRSKSAGPSASMGEEWLRTFTCCTFAEQLPCQTTYVQWADFQLMQSIGCYPARRAPTKVLGPNGSEVDATDLAQWVVRVGSVISLLCTSNSKLPVCFPRRRNRFPLTRSLFSWVKLKQPVTQVHTELFLQPNPYSVYHTIP